MTAPLIASTALSHVALRVRDVTRSIGWYQAVLGYEVLTDGPAPTPDRTRSAMGLTCGGALALELLETPGGKAHDIQTLGVAGLSVTVPDLGPPSPPTTPAASPAAAPPPSQSTPRTGAWRSCSTPIATWSSSSSSRTAPPRSPPSPPRCAAAATPSALPNRRMEGPDR